MDEIKRYLAEEVALDCSDGHITRREALRRLALLGVSSATATLMLAGCRDDPPARQPAANGGGPGPSPAGNEEITFAGPAGRTLRGSWKAAADPIGGVLVIHENRGLVDHTRSVVARFEDMRYNALAIDLLSEEGGTASLGDSANATAALSKVPPTRFVEDMLAGIAEIERRTAGKKIGAIGFCFGGGMAWRLVASKDPRIAAVAPFYGSLPDGADFKGSNAAVLGVYAELDSRVNASRDAAKAALEAAGLQHEIVTYPGADHAFFNDTGPRYNANAATQAWTKVQEWFGKYVANGPT